MAIHRSEASDGPALEKLGEVLSDVRLDDELARLTLDATTEGFWDWNVQTGTVRFSDSWLQSLGYERADLEPNVSAWKTLLYPDDVEATMSAVEAHFRGETEIYESKNRIRMKSGRYRWNRDRGRVISWTDDGDPLRMVGSDTDLTETVKVETILHAAFASAPNGMVLADAAGEMSQVNLALLEQFGYASDELVGQPVRMLFATEEGDQPSVDRWWPRPDQRGLQIQQEVRGRRKDGTSFPLEIHLSRCQAGDEPMVIAAVVDLSRQKERERFFELSSDLLCVAREDGYFARINPAFTRVLGWTEEELLGKPFLEFVHPEDRARTSEYVANLMGGGASEAFDNRYRARDGSYRWISWTVPPIDLGSRLIYAAGRNVTKARAAAETLEKAHAVTLQQSADLTRLNQELEHFVYASSHDLQEPVRNLVAYCDLLEEDLGDTLPEEAERDLEFIRRGALRMRSLILDLLALSRAGRSKAGFGQVSLAECASDAVEALDQRITEMDAHCEFGELPEVHADRRLLTQTLQNLINNAVKFACPGEQPSVRVDAIVREDEVEIEVRDNGIGIAPEKREEIFKPFSRLHGVSEYEGTGIGLAICRKAVERHGGRIWVEESPTGGSSFRFTLPNAETDEGAS